jgi:hypothetical protein
MIFSFCFFLASLSDSAEPQTVPAALRIGPPVQRPHTIKTREVRAELTSIKVDIIGFLSWIDMQMSLGDSGKTENGCCMQMKRLHCPFVSCSFFAPLANFVAY